MHLRRVWAVGCRWSSSQPAVFHNFRLGARCKRSRHRLWYEGIYHA